MKSSNSSSPPTPPRRTLGYFLKEQGLQGELKVLPVSGMLFCLGPGDTVYPSSTQNTLAGLTIRSIRKAGRHALMAFAEIPDRTSAARLRGLDLVVDRELLPVLPEGEYYYDEIVGLEARSTAGETLGVVVGIFETGSNDVYVVQGRQRQLLIPAIRDVIIKIDLAAGLLLVEPMDGLLD